MKTKKTNKQHEKEVVTSFTKGGHSHSIRRKVRLSPYFAGTGEKEQDRYIIEIFRVLRKYGQAGTKAERSFYPEHPHSSMVFNSYEEAKKYYDSLIDENLPITEIGERTVSFI
jgi:hypothetical protein